MFLSMVCGMLVCVGWVGCNLLRQCCDVLVECLVLNSCCVVMFGMFCVIYVKIIFSSVFFSFNNI